MCNTARAAQVNVPTARTHASTSLDFKLFMQLLDTIRLRSTKLHDPLLSQYQIKILFTNILRTVNFMYYHTLSSIKHAKTDSNYQNGLR